MKTPSLLLALVLLASAFTARATTSLDLGTPVASTPYDPYMPPVKSVLTRLQDEDASMDRVRQLMHQGRAFRYSFTTAYVAATPGVTAATQAGDCKAKALWLADQLNDSHVRFVIGKARSSSRIAHAWLLWQHEGRWWILDCTLNSDPIPADHVSRDEYIPFFSFGKSCEYRHGQSILMAAMAGNNRHA